MDLPPRYALIDDWLHAFFARKAWGLGIFVMVFSLLALLLASPAVAQSTKTAFRYNPPAAIQQGMPFVLNGQIPNNDELDDVYFCFRLHGAPMFRCLHMKLHSGTFYRATLPAKYVKRPGIEFYILGRDVDKKQRMLYGSPNTPRSIRVVRQVQKTPKPPSQRRPKTRVPKQTPTAPVDTKSDDDEETVYTAARKEQRTQQAPAVVAVYTAEDIQAAGWRTLLEALRSIVGIDINNNGHWPDIGMRGVNPRVSYGDKLIVLLDGHNMAWRQFNRNFITPALVGIDNIKRIEVIRGPGSTLWGANALSGVINIITKTNNDLKGVSSTIGGSPLTRSYFLNLQGGQELVKGLTFRGSFSMHQENRSPRLAPIYEFLRLRNNQPLVTYIPEGDSAYSQSFYAQLTWRELSLSFQQSRYDPFAPMSTFSLIGGDDSRFSTDRFFTKLAWATLLGSWGTLFLWTSFDSVQFAQGAAYESNPLHPATPDPQDPQRATRSLTRMAARDFRFEAGGQLTAQPVKNLSLSLGMDFEYLNLVRWHFPDLWAANQLDSPHFDNLHFSAFAQLQYNLANIVEFTVGGRFDADQRYGFVPTPRAAIVLTPGAGFYAKLLYGRAFKAPSFHDLYYFRKNTFYGNPTLRPESVHTFELQLGMHRKGILAVSINGYFSTFQDLIRYDSRPASEPLIGLTRYNDSFPNSQRPNAQEITEYNQKQNLDTLITYGGAFELRLFAARGFHLRASLGLFFSARDDKQFQPQDYASWLAAHLNASYRFRAGPVGISIALGGYALSPKTVPARGFAMEGATFSFTDTNGKPVAVPSWQNNNDPSLATPWNVHTYATLQVLGILRHLDVVIRITNILDLDLYDAGREMLYPQKKLDFMAWLRLRY